jgi:large subunit ribosomal protein L2
MAIKKYKPTSAGRRDMTSINYRGVFTTKTPTKSLTKGLRKRGGRNNQGRITTMHKGGGHKRLFRDIDFKYFKKDIPAKVSTIEYDPNRSGFIGILTYKDGEKKYILIPQSVKVGDEILVSENAPLTPGNRLPLSKIPVGTFVYNVELKPNGGAKLARSAGNYIEIVAQDDDSTSIKLPSTEIRKITNKAWASIGEVSNPEYRLQNRGKAGKNRHRGIRPTVRGSAMNPVDHPHGGGEGRQGIGLRRGPKTRQGKLAYGVKTRRPKKYSNKNIVTRRKTKRNK